MKNRVNLCVPYIEKDMAKSLGAKWDGSIKTWYAPYGETVLIDQWGIRDDLILDLIGEDRTFEGNLLFVDLIPRTCWFSNARSCIAPRDWDRVRKFIYSRANNKCECCGSDENIEAHERWKYENSVQTLMRLVALCRQCHRTTHIGKARLDGLGDKAKEHLQIVRKFDDVIAEEHIDNAFKIWSERNKIKWDLDLSLLTNNGIDLQCRGDSSHRL